MTFCLPLAYWKEHQQKKQQKDLEQPLIQVSQPVDIPQVQGSHAWNLAAGAWPHITRAARCVCTQPVDLRANPPGKVNKWQNGGSR